MTKTGTYKGFADLLKVHSRAKEVATLTDLSKLYYQVNRGHELGKLALKVAEQYSGSDVEYAEIPARLAKKDRISAYTWPRTTEIESLLKASWDEFSDKVRGQVVDSQLWTALYVTTSLVSSHERRIGELEAANHSLRERSELMISQDQRLYAVEANTIRLGEEVTRNNYETAELHSVVDSLVERVMRAEEGARRRNAGVSETLTAEVVDRLTKIVRHYFGDGAYVRAVVRQASLAEEPRLIFEAHYGLKDGVALEVDVDAAHAAVQEEYRRVVPKDVRQLTTLLRLFV